MPFPSPASSRTSSLSSLPGLEPGFDRLLRVALKYLTSFIHPPAQCRRNILDQAARQGQVKCSRRAVKNT